MFYDLFFSVCKAQTDILKSYCVKTYANEKLHEGVTIRDNIYNISIIFL